MPPTHTRPADTRRPLVSVAVALPVHDLFSYSVPDHLSAQVRAGMRVLVPLGRRTVTGFLIGRAPSADPPEVKHILDVLDETPLFPAAMIPFFKWITIIMRYSNHNNPGFCIASFRNFSGAKPHNCHPREIGYPSFRVTSTIVGLAFRTLRLSLN